MRVGLFGSFYPEYNRSGSYTTNLAYLLARSGRFKEVRAFVTEGARLPEPISGYPILVLHAWSPNNPVSLLRALALMWKNASDVDAFLFNIFLTSFGSTASANGLGLLLPSTLSLLTRKPVVVYMHNFLETQDAEALGYSPGRFERRAVRILERLILRFTKVIVPLQSQASLLSDSHGMTPATLFMPYMDVAYLAEELTRTEPPEGETVRTVRPTEPSGILLFGSWGPQKDLEGPLEVLRSLRQSGEVFRVTVAGGPNVSFPGYQVRLEELARRYSTDGFRFLGPVDDGHLAGLFAEHDILLLPYQSTGGQSGVMNLGALFRLRLISYDNPQLRETAAILGADARFVPKGDRAALGLEIRTALADVATGPRPVPDFHEGLARAQTAVMQLVRILEDAIGKNRDIPRLATEFNG